MASAGLYAKSAPQKIPDNHANIPPLTGQMPFLPPNQQRQSTVSMWHKNRSFRSFKSITYIFNKETIPAAAAVAAATVLQFFGWDYLGELVPEQTFTHSNLLWSSIILYLLPASTTSHNILLVQFTCLALFFTTSLQVLMQKNPCANKPQINIKITNPGLVAMYDIRPKNGTSLSYNTRACCCGHRFWCTGSDLSGTVATSNT